MTYDNSICHYLNKIPSHVLKQRREIADKMNYFFSFLSSFASSFFFVSLFPDESTVLVFFAVGSSEFSSGPDEEVFRGALATH